MRLLIVSSILLSACGLDAHDGKPTPAPARATPTKKPTEVQPVRVRGRVIAIPRRTPRPRPSPQAEFVSQCVTQVVELHWSMGCNPPIIKIGKYCECLSGQVGSTSLDGTEACVRNSNLSIYLRGSC